METERAADPQTRWIVWYIPTSTPLLSTEVPGETKRLITTLLGEGIPSSHLLLQTEHAGGFLGPQWYGCRLRAVLL
jgi:hypothetical protein